MLPSRFLPEILAGVEQRGLSVMATVAMGWIAIWSGGTPRADASFGRAPSTNRFLPRSQHELATTVGRPVGG
ncbi:MAG: hypothetical protein ABGX05_08325 [Pirellulaceae bacterium]